MPLPALPCPALPSASGPAVLWGVPAHLPRSPGASRGASSPPSEPCCPAIHFRVPLLPLTLAIHSSYPLLLFTPAIHSCYSLPLSSPAIHSCYSLPLSSPALPLLYQPGTSWVLMRMAWRQYSARTARSRRASTSCWWVLQLGCSWAAVGLQLGCSWAAVECAEAALCLHHS